MTGISICEIQVKHSRLRKGYADIVPCHLSAVKPMDYACAPVRRLVLSSLMDIVVHRYKGL